jgi:hypothetical protein
MRKDLLIHVNRESHSHPRLIHVKRRAGARLQRKPQLAACRTWGIAVSRGGATGVLRVARVGCNGCNQSRRVPEAATAAAQRGISALR